MTERSAVGALKHEVVLLLAREVAETLQRIVWGLSPFLVSCRIQAWTLARVAVSASASCPATNWATSRR